MMFGLLQFIGSRRLGAVVAICVAYSLAIQAIMASVGLSMSVGVADRAEFVLCGLSSNRPADPPAGNDDRQKPGPAPQCPFCVVAAETFGHVVIVGEPSAFPAYTGLLSAAISDPVDDRAFVSQFRHSVGEPRAPPTLSV